MWKCGIRRKVSCTGCGRALETLLGSRRITTYRYPFRAPTETLCTLIACWTVSNIQRGVMPILNPAVCVARRGREGAGLPTRQGLLDGCPVQSTWEGGRR